MISILKHIGKNSNQCAISKNKKQNFRIYNSPGYRFYSLLSRFSKTLES